MAAGYEQAQTRSEVLRGALRFCRVDTALTLEVVLGVVRTQRRDTTRPLVASRRDIVLNRGCSDIL